MNERFETNHENPSDIPSTVIDIIKLENALPESERRDKQNDIENERQRLIAEKVDALPPAELNMLEAFRHRKNELIRQGALHYKDIMRVLKDEGQVLGKENVNWRAVTRHLLVAELVAGELAKLFNQKGELVDETAVRLAALLHDLTKRLEYSEAAKEFEQSGQGDRYDFASRKQDELFDKENVRDRLAKFYPDIERVKNLSQAVGITVLRRGEPGEHLQTLEEKIIFYVDKILKHSAVVSLPERMADVARRYGHGKASEELEYTQKVEKELAAKLGIQPDEMPEFIQTLIINRVNQHENPRG